LFEKGIKRMRELSKKEHFAYLPDPEDDTDDI
jgi:hypothetical protein